MTKDIRYAQIIYKNYGSETYTYTVEQSKPIIGPIITRITIQPTNDLVDGRWTEEGIAIEQVLIDNENNLEIRFHNNKKKIKLAYDEVEYLKVLLSLNEIRTKHQNTVQIFKKSEEL